IQLVPQRAKFATLEIAGNERGLAGTWRRGDPDQRTLARLVQLRKQPLSMQCLVSLRPREFREYRHAGRISEPSAECSAPRIECPGGRLILSVVPRLSIVVRPGCSSAALLRQS